MLTKFMTLRLIMTSFCFHQALGYAVSTKMNVLRLIGQVMSATQLGNEDILQPEIERFISDDHFQRRMMSSVFDNFRQVGFHKLAKTKRLQSMSANQNSNPCI